MAFKLTANHGERRALTQICKALYASSSQFKKLKKKNYTYILVSDRAVCYSSDYPSNLDLSVEWYEPLPCSKLIER